ncbi:protein of unknown function DUF488 [Sulfobacillus acidophilus TPY]|nr:protein of unknown function DUF488 [Sulfobacillus acidophilus TPY]
MVDRLWPRGIAKNHPAIHQWMPDVAPSAALRQWYHQNRAEYAIFRDRYRRELADNPAWEILRQIAETTPIMLLTYSRNLEASHVPILRASLNEALTQR